MTTHSRFPLVFFAAVVLALLAAAPVHAQCGKLAMNPSTGKLDCVGPATLAQYTFATLPAVPAVGSPAVYCTDCAPATPCAAGGSGQVATSNGTAWTCGGAGSILMSGCTGTVISGGGSSFFPFQFTSSACGNTTSFAGMPIRAGTVRNLRVVTKNASATVGTGVATVRKNGSGTALTCTLSTAVSCADLTDSFTTASNDQITIWVQSLNGGVTTGPTWSSGGTSCTNGTQTVTFSNNTTGVNATGTITVSGNVPTGAVTVTASSTGNGYTAGAPPTAGQVATCTGASVFTGGTVTADGLNNMVASVEVY